MEVKLEGNEPEIKINAGDIVWFNFENCPHIITKAGTYLTGSIKGLIGIGLDGNKWCSDNINKKEAKLYKKEDWELVLRRKN